MKDTLITACIITILCNLPLAIGNMCLFFIQPDSQNWKLDSSTIDISMRQWLGISAFSSILYILVNVYFLLFRMCSEESDSCSLLAIISMKFLNSGYMASWIVSGCLINWSQSSSYSPSLGLSIYLKIILVCHLIFIGVDWTTTIISMRKNHRISIPKKLENENDKNIQVETPSHSSLVK